MSDMKQRYSDDGPQAKLGRAGETIIINYLSRSGIPFQSSVDQYDGQKDLLVEGKQVEIKTQVPFVTKDAFSFRKHQLKKCLSVDHVYFVSVPNPSRKHFSSGKVYRIKSDHLKYKIEETKDGREMVIIPIDQPYMEEVFTMSEEECNILKRYSISNWNSKEKTNES